MPIPEGYQFDSVDNNTGEIVLKEKPKDVRLRFKTVNDVLAFHGWESEVTFNQQNIDLPSDVRAYMILRLLAESLNEGWQPNWDDEDEINYYPWFDMRGSSSGFRFGGCDCWLSNSTVGSRLCFKSQELAEYAGKQFVDVYRMLMVI